MKVLTAKGISFIEDKLNVSCISEIDTDYLLTLLVCGSETDLIDFLESNKIEYIHTKPKTFQISQGALISLAEAESSSFIDSPRLWFFNKKKNFMLCSKMEHQHLSNTIHLFEMFCTLNKLSKQDSDNYLEDLKNNVLPEIDDRFKGEVLDYKPHYDWENKLLEDYLKATSKTT